MNELFPADGADRTNADADRILREIREGGDSNPEFSPWEPPTRRGSVVPATSRTPREPRLSSSFEPRVGATQEIHTPSTPSAIDGLPSADSIEEDHERVRQTGPAPARSTRPAPQRKRESGRAWKIGLIAAAVIVALAGIALGADFVLYKDKIHPGVVVEGVDVGGKTPDEARGEIESSLAVRSAPPVTVTAGEVSREILGEQIGLSFDSTAAVEAALEVGRSGSWFSQVAARSKAWVDGVELEVVPGLDDSLVTTLLDGIASEVTTEPVQSAVAIDGAEFSVIPGEDGTGLDREGFRSGLKDAFLGEARSIELAIVVEPMSITPEVAQRGIDIARRMVAEPATLSFEGSNWTIEPKQIAGWITFSETDTPEGAQLIPNIDASAASSTVVRTVGSKIGSTAKNASFYVEGGQVKIRPSQTGQGVDVKALIAEMNLGLTSDPAVRAYQLTIGEVEPEITTAAAQAMGIKDKLATYTTNYTAGAVNRNVNIHRMADILSGSLVAPGATWSFHETGGPTTVARGFRPAGAIMNGVAVDELGGGICQVSTTVFNTIFEAGLPILQRSPHSRYLSNYPAGRDAAVSWTVPDLKWQNNTGNWVLLTSSHTATTVTFTLWGTATGWKVTSSTSGWTMLGAGGEREIKNANMDEGTTKVVQSAQNGRSITVYRTVTKDGAEVRKDSFKSTYRPVDRIVEVGTRPVKKEEPAPEPTNPTPTPPAGTPPATDPVTLPPAEGSGD